MSSSDSSNTYDELPYSNFPFPASHPNRLVTRAAMAGLKAPAAATCRLLDVGCGRGGNLIPMGLELPDAEFVGIDLSRRQVEEGQRVIETLGLANVRIEQADLCDPPTDLGDFDFVIAHGVYSWMPKVARDALLDLIRQRLRRRGVAYVSYNVLPGWRLRTISRELMLYHTRNLTAPLDRVKQGRRILSFMAEQVPDSLPEYREVIASDSRIIENAPGGDSYAYHEFLEEENSPLYFWQFVEHAAEHGLAYLTASDPRDSRTFDLPVEVREFIDSSTATVVERHQYLDFLRNNAFRETLLCRQGEELAPVAAGEALTRFRLTAFAHARQKQPSLEEGVEVQFVGPRVTPFTLSSVAGKAAYLSLMDAAPWPIEWPELVERTNKGLGGGEPLADSAVRTAVLDSLLLAYEAGAIDLTETDTLAVREPSPQPLASAWARWQAGQENYVTNLRHRSVEMNEINRFVLRLLDGTRDRSQLTAEVVQFVEQNDLLVQQGGHVVTDRARLNELLAETVDENLRLAAGAAFLVQ